MPKRRIDRVFCNGREKGKAMRLEILLSSVLFGYLLLLALGYGVRVARKGRPKFDRIEQQGGTRFLGKSLMEMGYWGLQPIGQFMIRLGISPNAISVVSLFLGLVAGICVGYGNFGLGALVLAVSSLLDVVDGMVARLTGRTSEVGYVLDSQIDRYVEFFFIGGIAIYWRHSVPLQLLAFAALLGSYLVSYTTLMARFKNFALPPGSVFMRRAERIVYLLLGAALSPVSIDIFESGAVGYPMVLAVGLIAVFANLSAVIQLFRLMQEMAKRDHDKQRVRPAPQHIKNVVMVEVNSRESHEKGKQRGEHPQPLELKRQVSNSQWVSNM